MREIVLPCLSVPEFSSLTLWSHILPTPTMQHFVGSEPQRDSSHDGWSNFSNMILMYSTALEPVTATLMPSQGGHAYTDHVITAIDWNHKITYKRNKLLKNKMLNLKMQRAD